MNALVCAGCQPGRNCSRDGHLMTQEVTTRVELETGAFRAYRCGACGLRFVLPVCKDCRAPIVESNACFHKGGTRIRLARRDHVGPVGPVR